MQANMRKSGLQNAEDELSRYTNKNGEKGVISSTKNTSSSVPLTNSVTKSAKSVNSSVPLATSGSSSSSRVTFGAKALPVQSGMSSSSLAVGTTKPTSSSGVNPTYQGNDFLQWHKALFGTDYNSDADPGWSRPEWMSDVDYEIGTKLYNSYSSNKLLEDNYGSHKDELQGQYNDSLAALDANKNTAMQQADVLHQRVEKYLPTQLKAQGLGGLGIGQQMQLDAYNDYASNIGKINSEYNANRTDLDSSHNSALAELERGYLTSKAENDLAASDKVMDTIDKYRNEFANDSNVLLTDLLTYLNTEGENYLNDDNSISESNYNKLLEYLTDYEDRLTDADKARLEAALEIYGRKITKEGEINTKSYVERVVAGEDYSVQKEIRNLSEAGLDQIITDMRDTIIPSIASKALEEFGDAGKYMAIMAAAPLAFEEKVASGEMSKEEYVLTLISACATWGKAFDIKG